MFNKTKHTISKLLLKRQLLSKKKKEIPFSYNDVHEIGLIYNAENPTEANQVLQFANDLKTEGKKVSLLGFINNKLPIHENQSNNESTFFNISDLTFFNLPKSEKVSHFLNQNFDLLLNVYQYNFEILAGLVTISKAKYSVGAQFEFASSVFDLTIDTKANKDVYFLAKQMEFYLKVI